MHTQREIIDLALAREGGTYAELADKLEISPQLLSQYRSGLPFNPLQAMRIAQLAALDPAYVLACVSYQREQRSGRTETLPVWSRIAEHFAARPQSAPKAGHKKP